MPVMWDGEREKEKNKERMGDDGKGEERKRGLPGL